MDYLTSDQQVATPFLSPFEVESVHPLDMRQLKRLLRERNVGRLEIKVRGLDLVPEELRKALGPRGSESATLILAGGSGPARAILVRRLGPV